LLAGPPANFQKHKSNLRAFRLRRLRRGRDAAIYIKAIVSKTIETAPAAYRIASEPIMVFRNAKNCDITFAPSRDDYRLLSWRCPVLLKETLEHSDHGESIGDARKTFIKRYAADFLI
jgi:hypothetical protein